MSQTYQDAESRPKRDRSRRIAVRMVGGRELFGCPECEYASERMPSVRSHMSVHGGGKPRGPVDLETLTEKLCGRCRVVKPVSEFTRFKDPSQPINGWRYSNRCTPCNRLECREYGANNKEKRNERLREWRKKNPHAARAKERRARLKQAYGLTEPQVEAMFAGQDGRCLLCGEQKRLVIDHDHATGLVRGGLCHICNTFIGFAEAVPSRLRLAAAYISAPCPGVRLLLVHSLSAGVAYGAPLVERLCAAGAARIGAPR